ncbi:MAG: type 4a pilus biogenesis protein PilO [Pirellulales bacterium]|nr:type 4a pilus biogenesis protein PilO [Pirellulales bacterium]
MKNSDNATALEKFAERLHDPLQFRILVTVVILAIGYFAVYSPLDDRITNTMRDLAKAKEYQRLTQDVSDLRAEVARVRNRLPKNTDTNEWVQYILDGIRGLPVKMVSLDSADPKKVGPFEAVALQLELNGEYHGLESFLSWVETNERLFRIESISVTSKRSDGVLEMKLSLLGLQG